MEIKSPFLYSRQMRTHKQHEAQRLTHTWPSRGRGIFMLEASTRRAMLTPTQSHTARIGSLILASAATMGEREAEENDYAATANDWL